MISVNRPVGGQRGDVRTDVRRKKRRLHVVQCDMRTVYVCMRTIVLSRGFGRGQYIDLKWSKVRGRTKIKKLIEIRSIFNCEKIVKQQFGQPDVSRFFTTSLVEQRCSVFLTLQTTGRTSNKAWITSISRLFLPYLLRPLQFYAKIIFSIF